MENEIWRPVKGYEGVYEVSNLGRVRRFWPVSGHYRMLRPFLRWKSPRDYVAVNLSKGNQMRTHSVHRLVAEAFIPNPTGLPQVNHKDEDKTNNCAENLEWCDGSYNVNYGTGIERRSGARRNNPEASYPVGQYGKNGELIATYPSLSEAERITGIRKCAIRFCALGLRRKRKRADGTIYDGYIPQTAGGYKWKLIKQDKK